MEEDVLPALCAMGLIILVIAIIAFTISNLKPFGYDKRKEGTNTCLTITAKHNLNKVTVTANVDGEDIVFERRRIRKGQSVDFVYPLSPKPAKLVIEVESGNAQTLEV